MHGEKLHAIPTLALALALMCGCSTKPPEPSHVATPAGSEPEHRAAKTRTVPADGDLMAEAKASLPGPNSESWWRAVEKNPVAALKKMDPGALRGTRPTPRTFRPAEDTTPLPPKTAAPKPDQPPTPWPPRVGESYPQLDLLDQNGSRVSLDDFAGKIVLVELVGLPCKACHAFAGGNAPGSTKFRGIVAQPRIESIERYIKRFAGIDTNRQDVVLLRLVMFGMDARSAPSAEDTRAWAEHFGVGDRPNNVVLVGDARFVNRISYKMIPGFHLIDRQGILRVASTSKIPGSQDLYSELLPTMGKLARASGG